MCSFNDGQTCFDNYIVFFVFFQSTSPRRLYLSLERAGGTLGIVRVTFNVEYIVDEVVQTGELELMSSRPQMLHI